MVIFYRSKTRLPNERLSQLTGPLVHIMALTIAAYLSGTVCISDRDHERCFRGYTVGVLSFVISPLESGHYTLPVVFDGQSRFFETPKNVSVFPVRSDHLSIQLARFRLPAVTATPLASGSLPLTATPLDPTTQFATDMLFAESTKVLNHLSFLLPLPWILVARRIKIAGQV
jgi:hypothetical protein